MLQYKLFNGSAFMMSTLSLNTNKQSTRVREASGYCYRQAVMLSKLYLSNMFTECGKHWMNLNIAEYVLNWIIKVYIY